MTDKLCGPTLNDIKSNHVRRLALELRRTDLILKIEELQDKKYIIECELGMHEYDN